MAITVGYEPVETIGNLAYSIGRGQKSEYDLQRMERQAQIDAQNDMQLRLAKIRERLEREKMQHQDKRDNRLFKNTLTRDNLNYRYDVGRQQAQLKRQQELEAQKAQDKAVQDFMNGKIVPRPEYKKQFAELRKKRAEIEKELREGTINEDDAKQLLAKNENEFRAMIDPIHTQKNNNAPLDPDEIHQKMQNMKRISIETGAAFHGVLPDGTKYNIDPIKERLAEQREQQAIQREQDKQAREEQKAIQAEQDKQAKAEQKQIDDARKQVKAHIDKIQAKIDDKRELLQKQQREIREAQLKWNQLQREKRNAPNQITKDQKDVKIKLLQEQIELKKQFMGETGNDIKDLQGQIQDIQNVQNQIEEADKWANMSKSYGEQQHGLPVPEEPYPPEPTIDVSSIPTPETTKNNVKIIDWSELK